MVKTTWSRLCALAAGRAVGRKPSVVQSASRKDIWLFNGFHFHLNLHLG